MVEMLSRVIAIQYDLSFASWATIVLMNVGKRLNAVGDAAVAAFVSEVPPSPMCELILRLMVAESVLQLF